MEAARSKISTKDITYVAAFTALLAICSWISVPTPTGIPVTFQTFGIFLALGVLGGRRGTLAVLCYLLLGAIGVPVLAGFSGGFSAYISPSGGYLTGFVFTALLMWGMEKFFGKSVWVLGTGMVMGMTAYYVFGTVWFLLVYARTESAAGLMTVLGWCVFPYLLPDCVKLVMALTLSKELREHVR
ncbi:MAG: biotin transporter BioY [Oscillospiraceae bacterium]|nr:biotin transporter BioY [Oscillospiraceae bacterium]